MKILHSRLGPKSIFIVTLFGLMFASTVFASTVFARDFTFSWAVNTDSVDGYKLYYKLGDGNPPFDGTGAAEGSSPVVIEGGNITTFTLHGLPDTTSRYYFALTAYKGTAESNYSKIIISSQVPSITTIKIK